MSINDGSIQQKKSNPGSESSIQPLAALYYFADGVAVKLMLIGLVFALVQAILPPFVWLAMGDFVTLAIDKEALRIIKDREVEELREWGLTSAEANETNFLVDQQQKVQNRFRQDAQPLFIIMISLSLVTFIAAFIQRLAWELSAIRQIFRAKQAYINKLLHMDVAWLESSQSESIYQGLADHVPMTIFISCYLCVTLSVCFYIRWDVTLVMLTLLPVLIGTRLMFSKWFCKTVNEESRLESKITQLVCETFQCIETVISFAAQRQTLCKYERLSKEHKQLQEQRIRASSVYDSLVQVLFTELIFTIALCYGIWRVGDTKPGRLAALGINMLYMCVTSISIGFHLNGVTVARRHAAEMQAVLREAPIIERAATANNGDDRSDGDSWELQHDGKKGKCSAMLSCCSHLLCLTQRRRRKIFHTRELSTRPLKRMERASISLRNVHFAYPSRPDVEVLHGVSLDIAAGEHIAIVGPSGSGKSTLSALLLRFYDPTSGSIFFGGTELSRMNLTELRGQIALVSQEPILFDGTIADNIRYGLIGSTQGDVNDAARRAEAWRFISSLPQAMRTRVGDRGHQLSGGQKQRVAIARAVIRSPALIIFDEATSALDFKHAAEVQKAMETASRGTTTITIAHHLSAVKNADRIIVLEAGKIVEEGTLEELAQLEDGKFHRLHMEQCGILVEPATPPSTPLAGELPSSFKSGRKDQKNFIIGDFEGSDTPRLQGLHSPILGVGRGGVWPHTPLATPKPMGRSYSVHSMDSARLTLPIMSKGTRRRVAILRPDVLDMPAEEGSLDDGLIRPNVSTRESLKQVGKLMRDYSEGYSRLLCALPVTLVRGAFFLLVCFEVSSVLEVALAPKDHFSREIFFVAAIYTSLIVAKTCFEAVGRLAIALYGHGFVSHMRYNMFGKLLRHGMAYFDEESHSPGRLVHKLIADTASLNRVVGNKLDMLLPAVICSVVSLVVALWINWKLALLCSFQFPAFFAFRFVEYREAAKRQRQMTEEEKKAANLALVVLSNIGTIKAYSLEAHFSRMFCDSLRPLQKAMRRQTYVSAFVFACQFSFSYILIAATVYFGKTMLLNEEINVFDYLRVVLLTQFGANYISQLVASISDITKAGVAAENILAVCDEPALEMDNLSGEGFRPRISGALSLRHVDFHYPTRARAPVLRDINLQVEPGRSLAIVGASGAGKSSIMRLILRLYNPTEGDIFLDNYNIASINPAYLRSEISSVRQEPVLFSFSIRENIAYGLPEDEASFERIEAAARVANIHDFIVSLPKGYETEIGEFGAQLSGGQRQRVAIARAVVRHPKVLLLDEATAALDSESEKAVQVALEAACKECTCIHVAHRLSTIRAADQIVVLKEGKIVEKGTHQELINAKGSYYETMKAMK